MGTNPYGESMWKLAWGPSTTMRAAGLHGYRDILMAGPEPCWMILMWEPASVYGSPAMWYYQNLDEPTGLQLLGEYPYHGRYRVIHKLIHREMVNGHLKTEAMELSSLIIDVILPMTKAWQSISKESQVEALRYEQDLREKEIAEKAADAKSQYAPAFKGRPISFGRQGCRTSLIDKKIEVLERQFKQLMASAAQYQKGFTQRAV